MGTLEASYLMIAGGESAGGKDAEDGLNDGGDLRDGELNFNGGLEVHADDGDALVGLGLAVLDVVDGGGERALADGDDAAFHLVWRQTVVGPDDGDDGDIDVGEDVLGSDDSRADAEQKEENRHDDKGVRSPKRQFNNPHTTSVWEQKWLYGSRRFGERKDRERSGKAGMRYGG